MRVSNSAHGRALRHLLLRLALMWPQRRLRSRASTVCGQATQATARTRATSRRSWRLARTMLWRLQREGTLHCLCPDARPAQGVVGGLSRVDTRPLHCCRPIVAVDCCFGGRSKQHLISEYLKEKMSRRTENAGEGCLVLISTLKFVRISTHY